MIVDRSDTPTTLSGPAAGSRREPASGAGQRGPSSAEVGQDPEVPAAGVAAVVRGIARRLGAGRLADGVRERQQVVTGGAGVIEVDLVADDLPAARHGQPLGVELT